MTIQRLDAFFRTELTLAKPQFFNSITNLALAPLQRLVGQKQFGSLKNKADYVPQKKNAAPPSYAATLFKVVAFVCNFFVALVLTPFGIAARYMSFRSPQVDRAYTRAFLLQINPHEQTPEFMESAFAFIQKMTAKKRAEFLDKLRGDLFFSYLSLPAHRDSSHAFLSQHHLDDSRVKSLKKSPPSVQGGFLSLEANATFSENYLKNMTDSEYLNLMPFLSVKLIEFYRTQSATVTTVSPSLDNTSADVDLDALLDETLDDYVSSSSFPIPSKAASSLGSVHIEEAFNLEQLLAEVEHMALTCKYTTPPTNEIALMSQYVNKAIEVINLNFKSLLEHADNPGLWLEQESKTPSYCHPFAATHFLMISLEKIACIQPHLNRGLVAEWKDNYQQCVLLLKKYGLDQYIETEFPFSAQCQSVRGCLKMMSGMLDQNPGMVQYAQKVSEMLNQNPQIYDKMNKAINSSTGNPLAMMTEIAQEVKVRMTKQETEIDPAKIETTVTEQTQTVILFFQELDQVLQNHSQDATAVEEWLKSETSKPTYFLSFFYSQELLMCMLAHNHATELHPILKQLFNDCCFRLITLGLQRYIDETPPPEVIEAVKSEALQNQEGIQTAIFDCLTILRPLSHVLKRLPVGAEALNSNRETINQWFSDRKFEGNYSFPFPDSIRLYNHRSSFEGILDAKLLQEFSQLHSFCRDQLILLGLNNYLEERPSPSLKADTAQDRTG